MTTFFIVLAVIGVFLLLKDFVVMLFKLFLNGVYGLFFIFQFLRELFLPTTTK